MGPFSARAGESPSGGAQPGSQGTPMPASLVIGRAGRPGLVRLWDGPAGSCGSRGSRGSQRAWLGSYRKCSEPGQGARNVSNALSCLQPLQTHCCRFPLPGLPAGSLHCSPQLEGLVPDLVLRGPWSIVRRGFKLDVRSVTSWLVCGERRLYWVGAEMASMVVNPDVTSAWPHGPG